jgi:uncharacterized iron-regulated membrane protein
MKAWLLRLHRWLALAFALPLLVVIATGLVLSFEPILVMGAVKPGTLTSDTIGALIAKHDPAGQARQITHRSYEQSLTIAAGRGGGTPVDTATGEVKAAAGGVSDWLLTARRLHETLLLDATWLVLTSTFAMLAITLIGVLMGWPRFSNTLSGWHKGMAWVLLPLLVLSPLTGLFIAYGVTLVAPPAATSATQSPPPKLLEAVRIAGAQHDLSGLVWLRPQGGRMAMRIVEGGEYKVYAVTAEGTRQLPRNWPRLWHEGNFAGAIGTLPNIAVSLASLGLLITGVMIWMRRRSRLSARKAQKLASP